LFLTEAVIVRTIVVLGNQTWQASPLLSCNGGAAAYRQVFAASIIVTVISVK
jgi:hypothetical protein